MVIDKKNMHKLSAFLLMSICMLTIRVCASSEPSQMVDSTPNQRVIDSTSDTKIEIEDQAPSSTDHNQDHAQSWVTRCKEYLIDTVGIPLYVLYDRIKHEGPSSKDFAFAGLSIALLYGMKKGADHYCIGSLDLEKTRSILSQDAYRAWQYKGYILFGVGAIAACGYLIKTAMDQSLIERFKRTLTYYQKQFISSNQELADLVNNAHENPDALRNHEHFSTCLKDHQRKLLDRAVETHKSEIDPMSLFDDLVED